VPRINQFPRGLLVEWRKLKLPLASETVVVAVSGGADSVALLRVLLELRAELGTVLSIVHFNHKIREMGARMDDFALEFLNLAERSFGE